MLHSSYTHLPHHEDLIEVIDAADKPLLLMSKADVLSQSLPHRVVMVALRNHEGRILATRRTFAGPSTVLPTLPHAPQEEHEYVWGLSASTRVRAGESRLDAARRALLLDAGISDVPLVYRASKAPVLQSTEAFASLQVTLFMGGPTSIIPGNDTEAQGTMLLDKDELEGLANYFPGVLSPGLAWAVTSGALFTKKTAHTQNTYE